MPSFPLLSKLFILTGRYKKRLPGPLNNQHYDRRITSMDVDLEAKHANVYLKPAETWMGFLSNDEKDAANSVYTGTLNAPVP